MSFGRWHCTQRRYRIGATSLVKVGAPYPSDAARNARPHAFIIRPDDIPNAECPSNRVSGGRTLHVLWGWAATVARTILSSAHLMVTRCSCVNAQTTRSSAPRFAFAVCLCGLPRFHLAHDPK